MLGLGTFNRDDEQIGVGVRVLVHGYWGFAASQLWTSDEVVCVARDAVAQAAENAKGPPRTVDWGQVPTGTGTWVTPVQIDPFTVPIEEKLDTIAYWIDCVAQNQVLLADDGISSGFSFARQERVLATSEGTLITQTVFESGGIVQCQPPFTGTFGAGGMRAEQPPRFTLQHLDRAGQGWELPAECQGA